MMKHHVYRSLTTLVFAALATAAPGCGRQPAPAPSVESAPAAPVKDSYSVYDLGSGWRDQRGAELRLASLAGKPVALALVYTHCTASCPLTVIEMKRIERATDSSLALVLVSLDPERDSVGRLAAFAAENGLTPDRWTLLTGSPGDVRDLAAVLGVRYRQLSNDEIAHSNLVTLLDKHGAVMRQESGLGGADALIAAVRSAAR